MTNWRKFILRAVLTSLALTALAGVAAVFVSNDIVWRIAATSPKRQ